MSVLNQIVVHSTDRAGTLPVSSLTLDLLVWVASSPRCYAEAMEAWRTSCPRFPIWEDALSDDLIRLEHAPGTLMAQLRVVPTSRGQALIDAYRR